MAQGLSPEQQQRITDIIETSRMSISQAFWEAMNGMQKVIDEYADKE